MAPQEVPFFTVPDHLHFTLLILAHLEETLYQDSTVPGLKYASDGLKNGFECTEIQLCKDLSVPDLN